MTRFRIECSFQITGRGLVATGDVLSGTVRIGDRMKVMIEGQAQELRITSVEMGCSDSPRGYVIGLLVRSEEGIDLSNVKLQPQEVEVITDNTAEAG